MGFTLMASALRASLGEPERLPHQAMPQAAKGQRVGCPGTGVLPGPIICGKWVGVCGLLSTSQELGAEPFVNRWDCGSCQGSPRELDCLGSNPGSATYLLCILGQST